MPALSELLKGPVSDKLKQLIAPSGLIPAALFVLLTFAFVLPEARQQEFRPAVEFYDLEADAWQIAAIVFLILVVGYVLGSASSGVLDTLSGRTWNLSLSYLALSWYRGWRRDRLKSTIEAVKTDEGAALERRNELRWRRYARFAPDPQPSAPTALGDVLRAAEGGTVKRYAISLASVWESLRAALPADDAALKMVAAEKDSVDLMAGIWLALTAFFVEAAVLFSLWGEPDKVLLSLLTLPAAFVAYRVTVAKTVSWTDAATNVIALHHKDLRKKLGMRPATGTADRRALWQAASRFLLLGDGDPAALFDPPTAPPKESIRSSGNVEVDSTSATYADGNDFAATRSAGTRYSLIVTPEERDDGATTAAQVIVSNPAIVRILPTPELTVAGDGEATAEVVGAPAPQIVDALLIAITGLAPSEAMTIGFALPRWTVSADKGLEVRVKEHATGALAVAVFNPTDADIEGAELELFHVLDGRRTVHTVGAEGMLGARTGGATRRWPVRTVARHSSFNVLIELREQRVEGGG